MVVNKSEVKMKCPMCKEKSYTLKINKYFPFCSQKCKNRDLYKWLSGDYTYEDVEPAPLVIEEDKGEN